MVSIILIAIAGFANSVMDATRMKWIGGSLGRWWDWSQSWKNKYKVDENGEPIKPLTPRFWLSTSVFVLISDSWHFFQQLMIVAFCLAAVHYQPVLGLIDFFVFVVVFSGSFHIWYHWIFETHYKRKQNNNKLQ